VTDNNDIPDKFVGSFSDEVTADVITVMLDLGGELELILLREWMCQKTVSAQKSPSRADLEEQTKRWRDDASGSDLRKRAEQIILREIARLAAGFPVNGLMRFSIITWCRQLLEGKRGQPELGQIEAMYRLDTIRRIIKESKGTRAKSIVTKIMKELALKERSAKDWKGKAERLSETIDEIEEMEAKARPKADG
jgi:hypothetical protein